MGAGPARHPRCPWSAGGELCRSPARPGRRRSRRPADGVSHRRPCLHAVVTRVVRVVDTRVKDVNELVRTVFRGGCTDLTCSRTPTGPQGEPRRIGIPVRRRRHVHTGSGTGTGLSHAVIAPRLFLENLLLPPISDNADVAAALFDRPDITGTIAVGQHPGITSPDLAQAITDHLGRRVSYEPLARGVRPLLVPRPVPSAPNAYRPTWPRTSTTTTAPQASATKPATATSLSCC